MFWILSHRDCLTPFCGYVLIFIYLSFDPLEKYTLAGGELLVASKPPVGEFPLKLLCSFGPVPDSCRLSERKLGRRICKLSLFF